MKRANYRSAEVFALPLWVALARRVAQRFYLSAQGLKPRASPPFGVENHSKNLRLVFMRSCGIY